MDVGPRRARWQKLRVVKRVQETADAVSLFLEPTSTDAPPMRFRAGQFFTFELVLPQKDGTTCTLRRSYSIAAAEGEAPFVTIKRVPGGRGSTYLTETVRPGDVLVAQGPSGRFGFRPDEEEVLAKASHAVSDPSDDASTDALPLILIGGGSGITPLISLAETALRYGRPVFLFYGNRKAEDVIFAARLQELAQSFSHLTVVHVLEHSDGGLASLTGQLDGARAVDLLTQHQLPPKTTVFLCGPTPMMQSVQGALQRLGAQDIRVEYFTPPPAQDGTQAKGRDPLGQQARPSHRVTFKRTDTPGAPPIEVEGTGTILDLATQRGLEIPFSCAVGGCATCMVKVTQGQTDCDIEDCLTKEERAEGYVLACCHRPSSDCVVELPQ